jgi:hypothetical protein
MGATQITPNDNGNPFDVPLNSEIQESQQRQAATPAKPSGYVNPFDEPLASEVAEQAHAEAGQVTNDVGQTVIVPKDGESFADTLKRGVALGKQRQQNGTQQQAIDAEMATAPKKVAQTLGAAAGIGVTGPAMLALPGELTDLAVKHLAGDVLPGMEEMAARAKLAEWAPKVAKAATALGVGIPGLKLLWQAALGKGK